MNLLQAIRHHKLDRHFKEIAGPEVRSSVLMKRLKKDTRLAADVTSWPKSLAYIREQLECPASHGGKRDMSTARPNIVVANGRVTVHAQSK